MKNLASLFSLVRGTNAARHLEANGEGQALMVGKLFPLLKGADEGVKVLYKMSKGRTIKEEKWKCTGKILGCGKRNLTCFFKRKPTKQNASMLQQVRPEFVFVVLYPLHRFCELFVLVVLKNQGYNVCMEHPLLGFWKAHWFKPTHA
jgi:hypothetical protein